MIHKKIIALGILLGTGSLVHSSLYNAHSLLVTTEAAEGSLVHRTILIGTSSSQALVEEHTPESEPLLAKAEIKELKKEPKKATTKKTSTVASTRSTCLLYTSRCV